LAFDLDLAFAGTLVALTTNGGGGVAFAACGEDLGRRGGVWTGDDLALALAADERAEGREADGRADK